MTENIMTQSSTLRSYDKIIAEKLGLNEAIVLERVNDYLIINKQIPWYNHDGKIWVNMSYTQWLENDFTFWSKSTLIRVFKTLINNGYLIVADYNRYKFDCSKWYTINYNKVKELLETEQGDLD